jgi:hypothetical protein
MIGALFVAALMHLSPGLGGQCFDNRSNAYPPANTRGIVCFKKAGDDADCVIKPDAFSGCAVTIIEPCDQLALAAAATEPTAISPDMSVNDLVFLNARQPPPDATLKLLSRIRTLSFSGNSCPGLRLTR